MTKNHLENDLKKVSESHFGYIINIMRNANFSTRSSGRNIAMRPPERQSITPARKFRMLLHINPTPSEGNAPDPSLALRVGI